MRDEKEGRKKQARSNKQTGQSNTAHPRQSLFLDRALYQLSYMYVKFPCTVHVLKSGLLAKSHLGSSTRPLSVCLYISYVRHFWSRGPRATRKRRPAHLKFKGHMHACCIYVAKASRAITTLIERLHMYSSSLITSSAG